MNAPVQGTVVLVEDDPHISELVELYLRKDGFRVLRAPNGQHGLELVRKERPRLVLLDVGLPGELDGFALCRALRKREEPVQPLLVVVERLQLEELDFREDLFDDFVVMGASAAEIEARLSHLFRRTGRGKQHDLIVHGPLALNLETYQAALDGRPLDLTFMEYELLRFLAAHPGKVFTREVLLSRVWGYEYFGGARTVDVHVRRLRAKFGEEHAHLIETVRSVGYRFGTVRWLP